jgi:hypothetical protein
MTPSIQETVERLKNWHIRSMLENGNDMEEAAALIERLAGALEEIAESGAPRDEHELGTVDVWLRGLARSALSGEPR